MRPCMLRLAYLFFLFILAGCNLFKKAEAPKSSSQPSDQSKNQAPNTLYGSHFAVQGVSDRVIIFVHGIYGTPEDTWRASNNAYWPVLLKSDPDFPKADVFVAGYPTDRNNPMNTSEMANLLNNELKASNIDSKYNQIVFVCHSLGGLIVQQMLLDNRDTYIPKTKLIYFYGTPMWGSFVANFAKVFRSDPLLTDLSQGDGSQLTGNMDRSWANAHFDGIHRYCAYEKLPTPNSAGVIVVSEESATHRCDSINAIPSNHINMVKPFDIESYPNVLLRLAVLSIWRNSPQVVGYTSQPNNASSEVHHSHGIIAYDVTTPVKIVSSETRLTKTVCDLYGEAPSSSPAWLKDETCVVPDIEHLDRNWRQSNFTCCGGGATSPLSNNDIPPGIEIQTGGAYYWSIPKVALSGDQITVTTYCGPGGWPKPGCNVKVRVMAHYVYPPD